ncbi:MAG TPA: site-2 protease family protein [Streptosporangiaceae bacterium]|nr:site-2 protease family protein [Streptosporangiaceae bacterium]
MSFVLGVVIFVLALLISIMLHEAGHFFTAKKFHMKVTQFFVGFGQTLWSRRRGETEYGVKALPLGGFVKITGMTTLDEVDPADEPRSFRRQPGWQRVIVLVAGSFMHFALAFVLLFILAVGIGVPSSASSTTIGSISKCLPSNVHQYNTGTCPAGAAGSPAQAAGIRAGDKVVSIAGRPVSSWTQLSDVIRAQPAGKPVPVVVDRDGRQLSLTVTPGSIDGRKGSYLGIEAKLFQRVGPVSGVTYAGSTFGQVMVLSAEAAAKLPSALPDLFASDRSHTAGANVSSIFGAADDAGQIVQAGGGWQVTVSALLLIVISLNIFVGAFNLLPLLPLDGGHLAIVIYERVRAWLARLRGRPDPGLVDMQKLIPVSVGVFALLVGLGLILIAADIVNPVHLT